LYDQASQAFEHRGVSVMISKNPNNLANEVVVAYFGRSEDAERAIDDLLAEGFESRQIGAAFRGSTAFNTTTEDTNEVGSKTVRSSIDSNTVGSGPASDTRAVTPAGLSTGSGSVISGAGRPGPIPGSEIPHHRKTEIGSTGTVANPLPATGGFHEPHNENTWWEKLKHIFSSDSEEKDRRREGIVDSTSMNFGTGEGHLAAYPDNDEYAYSGSAFEGAFSGMGVPQSHAHSLVGEMRNGGAIVTISAAGRMADAEIILERNNGRVRYETAGAATPWEDVPGERVHVFGALSHTYPGYLPGSDASRRKAS
jgi:hypothetical protein